MAQAQRFQLISFELCPFVERSRIVLTEKSVTHDVTFIDLKAKPDWFLAISPMGRVPVLRVDDRPVFESLVINELIDELIPAPPMMPADPLTRAEARAWMIFAGDQLMPVGFKAQLAMAQGRVESAQEALAAVKGAFARLETQLASRKGTYFFGEAFGLIDAAYAPFFRRWRIAEGWAKAKILEGYPAVSTWADAVLARPSVVKAGVPDLAAKSLRAFAERPAS